MKSLAGKLGAHATLRPFEDADHSFHVPTRTGRKDAEVRAEMADAFVEWIERFPYRWTRQLPTPRRSAPLDASSNWA